MKRAAVFFDRDNTLIVSDGYLGDPKQVVLMEGAADAIAKCRSYGFVAVTISNQSGVARGMFGEQDVDAVNRRMDELLLAQNGRAVISRHEYCPYHPEAAVEKYKQESPLRKPKPGMILAAAEKLNLDLGRSWVIGDAPRDIEAGKAAGCRTILFAPPDVKPSPAAESESSASPDYTAASLKEAIEVIGREMYRRPAPGPVSVTLGSAAVPAPAAAPALAAVAARGAEVDSLPTEMNHDEESAEEDPGAARSGVMEVMSYSTLESDAGLLLPPEESEEEETGRGEEGETRREAVAAAAQPAAASRNGRGTAHDGEARKVEEAEPAGSPVRTTPVAPTSVTPTREKIAVEPPVTQSISTAKLEAISEQILAELKRRREEPTDFSVSKLFAGIVQVLVLAVFFLAYLQRDNPVNLQSTLLWGVLLQTLTIALLIMGRQR